MTAAGTSVPSRVARVTRPGLAAGRLLRLELRRSTMLLLLPLLAALLAATELRNDLSHAPLWAIRSLDVQRQLLLTGAVVAGVAAWAAARDGRRHTGDLVMTTSRPRWARQLANWAAVAFWAMLFYAVCVAVVFAVTARQATWGGPIWWLPGVGAAAVAAFSAAGFAFGAFFPSRFTAPLVAVGAVLAPQVGVLALQRHHAWGRVSPAGDPTVAGTGVFFPFHAGLSIVQIMFLAGVTAAALGLLALPAAAGGRRLRLAGAVITLAGLAAATTGVALAATARLEAPGVIIPALHSAASDKLITYTPACDNSGVVPVCLHPAYRPMLPALAAAFAPVFSQVAGLPGTPTRVQLGPGTPGEINADVSLAVSGRPPVLYLSPSLVVHLQQNSGTNSWPAMSAGLRQELQAPAAGVIIRTLIYGGPAGRQGAGPAGTPAGSLAQQAVAAALAKVSGAPLSTSHARPGGPNGATPVDPGQIAPGDTVPLPVPVHGSPAYAAFQRFAALPTATRHAWLATHLAALWAGRITLAEIP